MPEDAKSKRNQRLVLLGFVALALITIGATIASTMSEWNAPPPQGAIEDEAPGPAETL